MQRHQAVSNNESDDIQSVRAGRRKQTDFGWGSEPRLKVNVADSLPNSQSELITVDFEFRLNLKAQNNPEVHRHDSASEPTHSDKPQVSKRDRAHVRCAEKLPQHEGIPKLWKAQTEHQLAKDGQNEELLERHRYPWFGIQEFQEGAAP